MNESSSLDIDLDALSDNARAIATLVSAEKRCSVAAVVKANGYGLGSAETARAFLEGGASIIAVARLREALELRRGLGAPDAVPILVMGRTEDEDLELAVREGITLTIYEDSQARRLSAAASTLNLTAKAHVKVETGMNRLGLEPNEDSARMVASWAKLPHLKLEGVFSHLALTDEESDRRQATLFLDFVDLVAKEGYRFPIRHLADSIALLRYPEYRLDMVRAGAILYGMPPLGKGSELAPPLRFPAKLRSRVSRVRRLDDGEGVGYDATFRAPPGGALIATVPIGYADGYPRRFSNRASVLVRGVRAPVVGLICMDQLTVDVSAVQGVCAGDEVVLLGADAAFPEAPELLILELSRWAETNRNDILAGLSRRLVRRYFVGGSLVAERDYLLGLT